MPLGDLVENKSLILTMLCCLVASLLISAAAPGAAIFIASSFLLGITAVGTQMILPVAAQLESDQEPPMPRTVKIAPEIDAKPY